MNETQDIQIEKGSAKLFMCKGLLEIIQILGKRRDTKPTCTFGTFFSAGFLKKKFTNLKRQSPLKALPNQKSFSQGSKRHLHCNKMQVKLMKQTNKNEKTSYIYELKALTLLKCSYSSKHFEDTMQFLLFLKESVALFI